MTDSGPSRAQSMQEILASIRQVISAEELDPVDVQASFDVEPEETDLDASDILELTAAMRVSNPREGTEDRSAMHRRSHPVIDTEPLADDGSDGDPDERAKAFFDEASGGSGLDGSIEPLVREMLRPMLREWLDRNLPDVLERIVRSEVGALSRKAHLD